MFGLTWFPLVDVIVAAKVLLKLLLDEFYFNDALIKEGSDSSLFRSAKCAAVSLFMSDLRTTM